MTAERLMNSILKMALSGKIVPQNPKDEPASVLLERMRKDKEQLIKKGIIKKDKNPTIIFRGLDNTFQEKTGNRPPISITDEIPFDIPDNWEWVRLGNIFYHNTGKALNASNQTGQLLEYITTSNLYWNRFELESLRQMYFTDSEIEKCTARKGDLLVCEGGDFGRAAIWPYEYDIRIQNHIHRLRAYTPVCTEYYYYLFYLYKHVGWIGGKGIGIQGLSANALHSLLFPLPPVEEQKRIVEKIKEIEPYVDKYAEAEARLNTLNNGFPEQLKKSVLQLAFHGKLVSQETDDENATLLLGDIRAKKDRLVLDGRIKRDKKEAIIFKKGNSHYEKRGKDEVCIDSELPYDLPDNWSWARLGQCLDVRDGTHDTPKYVSKGVPLLTSKNLSNGKIDFSTAKLISHEDCEAINHRSKVDDGDIMFAMIGSIGNPVLYHGNDIFSIKNMALFKKIETGIDMKYAYWFLVYAQNEMKRSASGGVQSFVSLGYLRNYLIPIPPLNEQKRIVMELEKLLPLCERLMS